MSARLPETEIVAAEIASEAHRFTLRRALSGVASGAMTYSIAGPSAGIFSLFGFALAFGGPAFFWGWPIVCAGVGLVCLVFAELASHYPFAGVMYQWPTILAGRRVGWWIGWAYLFGLMVLLAGIYFILPLAIIPLFHLHDTTSTHLWISGIALAVAAIANALGIDFLGRFTVWGVAAELVVAIGISTLLLITGSHQSPSVLFHTGGQSFSNWVSGFITGGVFIAIWVMFGFETSGTLGEETRDAKRAAPRAILGSYVVAGLLGLYTILSFIIATPSISAAKASGTPILDEINAALPNVFSKIFLVLVAEITILAANVAFTGVARMVLGMARDNQLPAARFLSRTHNGTPWVAILVVACLTALPFVASTDFVVIATGATAAIYVTYVAVMGVALWARVHGWPENTGVDAPFSLGRWGTLVNIGALFAAGAILVDLLWPRATTNPDWKLGIPVAYWIVGVPLVVGFVYYVAFQHRRISRHNELEASAPAQAEA
jgi:amino acid transporter